MDALKNLEVWRVASRFSVDIFDLVSGCSNRSFADQLGRSALSVASNIAEGYERESRRERAHFLKIAKGSCAEAFTQILIGVEAGFLARTAAMKCANDAVRIRSMLFALIRQVENATN